MKTIVRIISALAAFALITGETATNTYALDPASKKPEGVKAYNAGEKVSGFTVVSVDDFNAFSAKVYVFEHEKTGAKAVFIQNDDTNKYFALEFNTRAENNKGTAHVLEHCVMSGSGKYPSRSLSNALKNRSYITYMNAFTKSASTVFPVASLSEKQLLKMAGYYTDLCFDPSVLRDEDIFKTEAWRFTYDETSGKAGVNGTIYSEMSGRYSADMEALGKAAGLLYPGCPASYIAGGTPQDILTLSYGEVKDFYERYYHPSNCVAYIYGDIKDAGAFLDILDGQFEGYEKKEYTGEPAKDRSEEKETAGKDPDYVEMKYDFPALANHSETYKTEMVFAIDLGKLPDDQLEEMYAFTRCCNRDYSAPLMKLASVFPGSEFNFSIIPDSGNVILSVSAGGMEENEAPMFRAYVLDIFRDMAVNGLRDTELEYFRDKMETDAALAREGTNAVSDMLMSVSNYASNGRDLTFYMKMRDRMSDMSWFDNNLVKKLAGQLNAPRRSSMAVVTPRPGLQEEINVGLEDALDEFVSSMSPEEKKKLAQETARIADAASDDPSAYLEELNVTKVSDLEDELKKYTTSDETDEKGLRRVGVYTSTEGVQLTKLYIDASNIPQDMLGYLSLYVDLVNGLFVPTGEFKQEDIADIISGTNIRGQDIGLTVSTLGNSYKPYVTMQFMSSPEMTGRSYELAYERLFDSIFDNPTMVSEGIRSIRKVVKDNIESNPEQIARYIAYSADAKGAAYYENTHYIEYYEFLGELEKNIGGDYKSICAKLKEVGQYLCHTSGTVVGYALPKDDEEEYLKTVGEFEKKLGTAKTEPCDYTFEKYEYPLGIKTGLRLVGNVAASGDITKYGIKSDDAGVSLALSMITEQYLRGQTRDRYGAYICSFMEEHPVVSVYTARDPMIKETYDAFAGMKDAWAAIRKDLTQKELDEYITQMYSIEMLSSGDISDATLVLSDVISGRGSDRREKRCATLKNLKVEDLAKYDKLFEKLGSEGQRVTDGSADVIDGCPDMFSQVIDPFAN